VKTTEVKKQIHYLLDLVLPVYHDTDKLFLVRSIRGSRLVCQTSITPKNSEGNARKKEELTHVKAIIESSLFEYLSDIVSQYYDLGKLISVERNETGYVNISYDIETLRGGERKQYILRCYRQGTHENKIKFEHALMKELPERGFDLAPSVVVTKDGSTYAIVPEKFAEGNWATCIAVFSYLLGEDRYSWDAPLCTSEELTNAAEVLALYHNTIFGWEGAGNWKEPRIIEQIPLMVKQWRAHAKNAGNSVFDLYFAEHSNYLLETLKESIHYPTRAAYDTLPHLAIHGDYHPGNLKFLNRKISGLFDFDWAKMDARCFDVGLAITYFCSAWEGSEDGNLLLERVISFLDSYQKIEVEDGQELGPLTSPELENLPHMILASNAYVLDWAIGEFYTTHPDAEEYARYLQHGVRLMKWLGENWISLMDLVLTRR
jgi:homoserine kinase type II